MPFLTNEPLIKQGTYVYFKGKNFPKPFANNFFKIGYTQQIPYYRTWFVDAGKYVDIRLSDIGLYPESYETLYEVRFGMKGNGIIYVRYPTTAYYNVLEKSGFIPDDELTDPLKRYIGGYTKYDIPYDAHPPRLIEYTVKDFDSIVYRLYCDSIEAEKIILRMVVNRCMLLSVSESELKDLENNFDDYIADGMLRIIPHPKLARWEI